MKTLTITLVLSTLLLGLGWRVAAQTAPTPAINTLTEQEKKDGWKLLFDGKTPDGWRVFKKQDAGKWTVKDGLLVSPGSGGDLISKDKFANFEIQVDWLCTNGNNSGILYRIDEEVEPDWKSGPEMQIMAHDSKAKIGKTSGGALYDLFAPKENHLKSAKEWNTFKVVANGKHLENWVNGIKVVECDIGSDDWNQAVAKSRFKNEKQFAANPSGHIVLQQYHGNRTEFRNIKIRVLPDNK